MTLWKVSKAGWRWPTKSRLSITEPALIIQNMFNFLISNGYNGIFPCFFGGLEAVLLAVISNASIIFRRVSWG